MIKVKLKLTKEILKECADKLKYCGVISELDKEIMKRKIEELPIK